jgi:4-amino-4-deoxy-L-arabinose transferase-like glycosyltransferase
MRLWGIRYGLPYLYHPDEPLGVSVALNMIKTGDLNPHFFGYGSLFFYLNALAYIPYYMLGHSLGLFHTPSDIPGLQVLTMGVGRTLMPSQIVLGRLVSVVVGMLCIFTVYWLGTRLSNRLVGLLAAAFVTFSPTLVLHSQFITPNILVTFLVLLTLAALLRLTPRSRWTCYAFAGIAWGCAMVSKYNSAMLVIPFGITYWMLHGWNTLRRREVYLGLFLTLVTFIVVTPYAILDFSTFVKDTEYHLAYYATAKHPGMEGDTVKYYLSYLLNREGLLAFLGLLPIIFYIRRHNRNGLILLAFAIPYVLYVSTLRVRNDRTILIALPVLFVTAADLLCTIWQYMSRSRSFRFRRLGRAALVVFITASIAYLGWKAVEQNINLTTPDAREYSRQWIEANVPAETRIAAETYSPFIDPARYSVTYFPTMILHPPDWYAEQGFDLLVFSSGAFGRYYVRPDWYADEVAKYNAILEQFPEIARFDQNGTIVRILRIREQLPR